LIKLNYIVSHPIYYQNDLLNYIDSHKEIELNVYFYKKFDLKNHNFDNEFKQKVNFTKNKKINYKYKFINRPKNFYFLLKQIINFNNKSFFWFHGWNSYYIFFLIFFIKIFSNNLIFIRAENIYKDKILSRIVKKKLFKYFDYFLYIGKANYNYFKKYQINDSQLIPLKYSSGINNKLLLANKSINKKIVNENKIIFVGKLIERKNVIFLIKSFKRYNDKFINKFYLDIYGDGPLKNKVLDLIDNNRNKYIKLKGFIPNHKIKSSHYKNYNFIILASNHENWGLVINEAMESKLALLLGSNVGCKHDLLRNNINGFSFSNNYKSLEIVLNKVSKLSVDSVSNFGDESFKIISNYTIESSSKKFIKFLLSF
jgi:hypothetical protein